MYVTEEIEQIKSNRLIMRIKTLQNEQQNVDFDQECMCLQRIRG